MTRTLLELERELRGDGDDHSALPGPDRLDAIHLAGRRYRRRRRLASAGAGVATLALVAGLGWAVTGLGDGAAIGRDRSADRPVPTKLSPLAERALREIPGARKVSAYQVVLPDPDVVSEPELPIDPEVLVGDPIALPATSYAGVTSYPEGTFPGWLHDGVQRIERGGADPEEGWSVGTFAAGIHVSEGTAWLGCVAPGDGAGPSGEHDPCTPTLMHRTGDDLYVDWGMGTDDFLEEGSGMEIFGGRDDFTTSRPTKFWIAGVDGEVARVDFLLTDGGVVPGQVAYDTVSPGDSMFWANVPGELARVVTYGPDGAMLEVHPLKDCSTPVECEVR